MLKCLVLLMLEHPPPSLRTPQVISVNGQKITNLKDLVRIVDTCSETFLDLDLDYRQKVVLHTLRCVHLTV